MAAYRISEAADKAGFTASALRFYEASGLVPAAARTLTGYRTYDDAAGCLPGLATSRGPASGARTPAVSWCSSAGAHVDEA